MVTDYRMLGDVLRAVATCRLSNVPQFLQPTDEVLAVVDALEAHMQPKQAGSWTTKRGRAPLEAQGPDITGDLYRTLIYARSM